VARACGIGLNHGECAVCGHGFSLNCDAKVLRISLFKEIRATSHHGIAPAGPVLFVSLLHDLDPTT
jgi:hypothetical protein